MKQVRNAVYAAAQEADRRLADGAAKAAVLDALEQARLAANEGVPA